MFSGRLLLIASKHEKAKVLAPLLERALSVQCISLTKFDTDILGTFNGEVERADTPLITLRKKCRMAAEVLILLLEQKGRLALIRFMHYYLQMMNW
jgi:hypothetical protein